MKNSLKRLFQTPSPKKVADKHLPPEETIRWVEDVLRTQGVDIFHSLKRVDKGRLGIPVYMSLYGAQGLTVTGNLKQMGKGATEELAKASALMELIERYSLFKKIGSQPFLKAPLKDLGPQALSLDRLLESVEDPEGDPQATEAVRALLPQIPLHWELAYEVSSGQEVFLPIYWFWLLYEYNGSSAGNTWAEAAVQGACELVERHVSALASRENTPLPALEIDLKDPEIEALIGCYRRLGVKLYLRDMTLGLPVPTIAALAYDPSSFPKRSEIVYTAGTATSPKRALIRALTEVAQLAGDFDTEGRYLESGLPKYTTLEEAMPVLEHKGQVTLGALPDLSQEDHVEELHALGQALAAQGLPLYVCDFTDPALNIPVVYSIMLGGHFRDRLRLAPLYQLTRVVALYLPGEEAREILLALREKAPTRYYLESYLGQVLANLGELKEARQALQRALDLDPPLPDRLAITCHLAHVYVALEDYAATKKVVENALAQGALPELYNLLGTACFKQGDIPAALEAYTKALELNPQSAQDHANVGACLARLGLGQEAEKFFQTAEELDPTLDLRPYRRLLST